MGTHKQDATVGTASAIGQLAPAGIAERREPVVTLQPVLWDFLKTSRCPSCRPTDFPPPGFGPPRSGQHFNPEELTSFGSAWRVGPWGRRWPDGELGDFCVAGMLCLFSQRSLVLCVVWEGRVLRKALQPRVRAPSPLGGALCLAGLAFRLAEPGT